MLLEFFLFTTFVVYCWPWYDTLHFQRGYIVHPNRRSCAVYTKISTCLFDTSQIPLHTSKYSKDTQKTNEKERSQVLNWKNILATPSLCLRNPSWQYSVHGHHWTDKPSVKTLGKVVFAWLCHFVGLFLWKLAH